MCSAPAEIKTEPKGHSGPRQGLFPSLSPYHPWTLVPLRDKEIQRVVGAEGCFCFSISQLIHSTMF
jgi:hypothetical protein